MGRDLVLVLTTATAASLGTVSGGNCKPANIFGSYAPEGSIGKPGSRGLPGKNGNPGKVGKSGLAAHQGRDGRNGIFLYQVSDETGRIKEQSGEVFTAKVLSYVLVDENNDGIFEPGAQIFVKDVQIYNPSPLTLPEGSILNILKLLIRILVSVDLSQKFSVRTGK